MLLLEINKLSSDNLSLIKELFCLVSLAWRMVGLKKISNCSGYLQEKIVLSC